MLLLLCLFPKAAHCVHYKVELKSHIRGAVRPRDPEWWPNLSGLDVFPNRNLAQTVYQTRPFTHFVIFVWLIMIMGLKCDGENRSTFIKQCLTSDKNINVNINAYKWHCTNKKHLLCKSSWRSTKVVLCRIGNNGPVWKDKSACIVTNRLSKRTRTLWISIFGAI